MLVWLGISLVKTKTGQNGPFCLPLSTSIKIKRKSCELSNVQSLRKAMSSFHQKKLVSTQLSFIIQSAAFSELA